MRDLSGEAYTRMLAQRKRADSVEVVQAAEHRANGEPPLPLSAFVGTYVDSLYGDAIVSLKDGQLELKRGDWHGAARVLERDQLPLGQPPGVADRSDDHQVRGRAGQHRDGPVFRSRGRRSLLRKKGGGRGGRGGRGGAL